MDPADIPEKTAISLSDRRCNELEQVVNHLRTEIDSLREFSELERSFMENEIAEERSKNVELAGTVENLQAQHCDQPPPTAIQSWAEKLRIERAESGLTFYRNCLLDTCTRNYINEGDVGTTAVKQFTPHSTLMNAAVADLAVLGGV